MSEENKLAIVKTSPFGDSFKSTLGAGAGVALIVGVPTVIVGGVVLYIGWRIWSKLKEWRESKKEQSKDQLQGSVSAAKIGEVEVNFIEEKKTIRAPRQKRKSRSIVR